MTTITGALNNSTTDPAPKIECYIPAANPNKIGLIIFPGGGYGGLAEHEGKGYADYFVEHGIACFVVEYRLGPQGHRHPAMIEDAFAAICTIRARAEEFGINPNKIGVMGSSAGGHLTSHSLVAWNQYASDNSLRPDFGILCYPVITTDTPSPHTDSFHNLLGKDPSKDLLDSVSCEKLITTDTPPCFLWHTAEDQCVPMENSMLFAARMRECGVPFELHLYNEGQHGLGLGAAFDWAAVCLRWIEATTAV